MAGDSSRIKGLTVEIGGDSSELTTALKAIDKESKKTSGELKSINELLKLDPKNTELLAQKQKVLADAVAQAAKKVETLKAAEKSAREQLEKNEIGQEQFRALQRETIRAENRLNKLQQQLSDTEQAAKELNDAADETAEAVRDSGKAAEDAAGKTGNLADRLDDLKNKYKDAKDAAKDAATDLAGIGAAAVAVGTAVIVPAASKEDALASIQASTGASASQMTLYENGIDEVYGAGFGEDLDDVAATMALVKQLSNETNAGTLTDITKDAITLRETFGYDTQESMRASKMLVDQFGLSYKESFNLIAQATQKGMNRSGDFLDILNEYSVHFKGLGYDAEGMLAVLEAGSESGAFSLDKVGDAAKELGIRLLDNADSTTEAYTKLNLDADEYRQRIAAGGETAQNASSDVIRALLLMDDQVAQNEIGVALFGTMWEDLGVDAIASLLNVNGTMDKTKSTMQDIRDIKYGTTSNEWKQLGRTVQTELIAPLGEKLLPTAKKFCSYLSENLDKLIPTIKKVATVAASIYVGMKAGQMVGAVVKLVQAFKALQAASLASNAAMAASPWGAIGAAIGLVVGAVVSLVSAEKDAEEAAREHLRELKAAADEQTAAYRESAQAAFDAADARRETAGAINEEYDRYGELMDELEDLVDAEGNVLKGNEDRVEFIRGTLSDAIGEEIEIVDGQIQKYGELKDTIRDVLVLKRGEALANKLEGEYNETKDNLDDTQMKYEEANAKIADYNNHLARLGNLQKAYTRHLDVDYDTGGLSWDDFESFVGVMNTRDRMKLYDSDWRGLTWEQWNDQRKQIEDDIADVQAWLTSAGDVYANQRFARAEYDAARATIDLYEDLTAAIYSGSTEQILAATEAMENGMATFAQGAAYTTLYDQALELYQAHKDALTMSQNEGSTITGAQLSEMRELATRAFYEAYTAALDQGAPQQTLDNLLSMLSEVGYASHLEELHEHLGSLEEFLAYLTTPELSPFSFAADPSAVLGSNPWGPQSTTEISTQLSGAIVGALTPLFVEDDVNHADEAATKVTTVLERIYRAIYDIEPVVVVSGTSSETTDKTLGRTAALKQRGSLK